MMVFSGDVSSGFQGLASLASHNWKVVSCEGWPCSYFALSFLAVGTISLEFPPCLRIQVGRKGRICAFLKHSPPMILLPILSDMTT